MTEPILPSDQRSAPPASSRRGFVLGAIVVLAGAGGLWFNSTSPATSGEILTPHEARDLVQSGEIILIDIRRPDEWKSTGLAQGAIGIDMRRKDFDRALTAILNGDRSAAVAVICARGVRSKHTAARMKSAGFTNVSDVSTGMLGSRAGKGWVPLGLPLRKYDRNLDG